MKIIKKLGGYIMLTWVVVLLMLIVMMVVIELIPFIGVALIVFITYTAVSKLIETYKKK